MAAKLSALASLLLLVPAQAIAQVDPSSFGPPAFYASGNLNTARVAVGDLNGDGSPDLVTVSQCFSSGPPPDCHTGVSVLINNGDGTFKAAVTYEGDGMDGYEVAIADVDADGKPDLVVLNGAFPASMTVMRGNGDGTFQTPVGYPLLPSGYNDGQHPAGRMAVGDINGDGKPDVVVSIANDTGGASLLTVLLNAGDGSFPTPAIYHAGGLFGTPDVIVADVNGDGIPDLIDVNLCSTPTPDPNGTADPCFGADGTKQPGTIGVLLGNGDGTFQAPLLYFSGGYAPQSGISQSLAAVDLNHDGKLDLLLSNQCCESYGIATVLMGNGDGTFQAPVNYNAGTPPGGTSWITAADVDGDGYPDAITVSPMDPFSNRTPTVSVLLGNGDGTLQRPPACSAYPCDGIYNFYPYLSPINMIVATDLNGDGKPDLIAAIGCGSDSCAQGAGVRLNETPRAATTTSGGSTLNPSSYGQSVTFTATVTPSTSGTPTGNVTFTDGFSTLGSSALVSGTATLSVSTLSAGAHKIVATYSSDSAFRASMSAPLAQNVNKSKTTTAVAASPNPSSYLQSVTFTATVMPAFGGAVTGSVTFKDGSTVLGSSTLAGATATFSTSSLGIGTRSITAVYGGDTNVNGSTSTVLRQSVRKASTTTSVLSSLNPSFVGQSVTFTTTINGAFGGTPTGTVTFKQGTTVLGTVALTGGTAALTTSALAAGSDTIVAAYGGDPKFKPSTGSVKEVVDKYVTTTTVASSSNPSTAGQPVTFTATVSSASGPIPDGETVTFKNGSTVLGTGTTSAGQASLSTSALAVGSHTIVAIYAGDATFATSTGKVKQTITP